MRRKKLAALLLLTLTGLWPSAVGFARIPNTPTPLSSARADVSLAQTTFSGFLALVWRDEYVRSGIAANYLAFLVDESGAARELEFPNEATLPEGGLLALDRSYVSVAGTARWHDDESGGIVVDSIRPESLPPAKAPGTSSFGQQGGKPWLSIMVRFGDGPSFPRSPSFVQSLMSSGSAPSLDHYWREVSYGAINLAGSRVVGPYTLPQPKSYYVYDQNGDGSVEFDGNRATNDALALADPDVRFPDFAGINLMFGEPMGGEFGLGGSWATNRDGEFKWYGFTWLSPWAWQNQGVLAHEMGHALGLPHSSAGSLWDVMSGGGGNCNPCDPTFGSIAVDTISFHKDLLGWIPRGRRYDAQAFSTRSIALDALARPASGETFLMALVPISVVGNLYYTVEARRRTGYDGRLLGEGVIIHRVDLDTDPPAQVVDATDNGNPNDDGAMWRPGERFEDPANGIVISVDETTTTGYRVTITLNDYDDTPCPAAGIPEEHWKGEYFATRYGFGLPVLVRDDGAGALAFDWRDASPSPECEMPADNFRVRWSRVVTFDGGKYTFKAATDDGIRVFVDGRPILEKWFPQPTTEYTVDVELAPGEHRIEVEYFEAGGAAVCRVTWERGSGFALRVTPATVSRHPGQSFTATVSIVRSGGFTYPVTVTAPSTSGIRVRLLTQPSVTTTGSEVRFNFRARPNAVRGTHRLVFVGTDAAGNRQTAAMDLTIL